MEDETVTTCSVHGGVEASDATIDLTSSQERFHQFTCFLATLQFRILNQTSGIQISENFRQQKSNLTCNLLFNYLDRCDVEHIYYPLRALSEYFNHDETLLALYKCLNSESLLEYKLSKETLSEDYLNKSQPQATYQTSFSHQQLLLDILTQIDKTMGRLTSELSQLDSLVLCLKMLGKIVQVDSERSTNAI